MGNQTSDAAHTPRSEGSLLKKLKLKNSSDRLSSDRKSTNPIHKTKRKISKKFSIKKRTHSTSSLSKKDGNKFQNNTNSNTVVKRKVDSHSESHNKKNLVPTIRLDAPNFELPDIASIRSSKSKRNSRFFIKSNSSNNYDNDSDMEEPEDKLTIEVPRRSLQNSNAGYKRYSRNDSFNIPVPIEDNTNFNNSTHSRINSIYSDKEKSHLDHSNTNTNSTTNNNEHSIMSTILSIAHNAISHNLTKNPDNIQNNIKDDIDNNIQTNNSKLKDSIIMSSPKHDNNTREDNNDPANKNDISLNKPNPFNNSIDNSDSIQNETVIHSTNTNTNTTRPKDVNRSTSFLRHLDYLLQPSVSTSASVSTSTTSLSNDNNNIGKNSLSLDRTEKSSLNKVKFESISSNKISTNSSRQLSPVIPTINTMGNGDLSLDLFENNLSDFTANTKNINDNNNNNDNDNDNVNDTNIDNNVKNDINGNNKQIDNNNVENLDITTRNHDNNKMKGSANETDKVLTPILDNRKNIARNNSYLDISKNDSKLDLCKFRRARSKTLPSNDIDNFDIDNNNNNITTNNNNNNKRNSRYSSLSNDEMINTRNPNNTISKSNNNNNNNERKTRSMSKHFLNKRSFSPAHIGKVLPVGIRNSISKTRVSSENNKDNLILENNNNISNIGDNDNSRPRSSNYYTANPVVNIDLGKPTELEGIEYSNEKKDQEFHSLFKDSGLSKNERLIIDHSCALSKDILLQGRLYISDQHLCFYSNILGWVSTVIIPFKEIVQIEKKTTAGIFPNGIVIDTLHTKYIFASFISRDSTFDLITDVWNQIILGRKYVKDDDSDNDLNNGILSNLSDNESNASFHDSDDVDNDDDDDDEEDIDETDEEDDDEYDDDLDDNDNDLDDDTDMTSSDELENINNSKGKNMTSMVNNMFPGPLKHSPTKFDYKPVDNEKFISETIVNAPLGQVADILYGDDTSKWEAIIKAQKNFDLSPIPKLLSTKTRDYSYFKPLNFGIGPNKTKCLIVDKLIHYDLDDYVQVIQESKTPDVPSGNSFTIRTNTILTWDSNNSTKITVYFLAEWTSKSWLKSAIEKGAFDGVIETTKIQNNEIIKFTKEERPKANRRSSSRASKFGSKGKDKTSNNEKDSNQLNLPTLGPLTHTPTEPEYIKSKNDVIIDDSITFNAPLGTIFQLLYGDDHSYIKNIITKMNSVDISDIPKFVNNEREYTYVKKLNNSLGPKQTKCTITEKIEHMDINNYILVKQTVRSHDVPYGNVFTVQTRNYFSWGPNNSTKMLVVLNVVWTGRCLLKGTIEKGSLDGQKLGTKITREELQKIISTTTTKRSRSKSKSTRKEEKNIEKIPVVQPVIESTTGQNINNNYFSNIPIIGDYLNFDLLSIKGLFMSIILLFLFFKIITSLFTSGNSHKLELLSPGRINIDGHEYTYLPNVKTLYQVYEDEVRKNVKASIKNKNFISSDVVQESNEDVWNWLEQHSRGHIIYNHRRKYLDDAVDENYKDYKMKKLKDSIQVAEIQLQEMREVLSRLQY